MQVLTLAAARKAMWNQASALPFETTADEIANVNARLNLASEQFFQANSRGTFERAIISAYDGIVTLPRTLQTILGVKAECCHSLVRPIWYEFIGGSCCLDGTSSLNDLGEGFCTFRDIPEPLPLRIKSTESAAATLTLTGKTDTGATFSSAVNLTVAETDIATLTAKITKLHKPATTGAIEVYHVDGLSEVLIATLEAGETDANYRRYRVGKSTDTIEAICKRAFIPAVADSDPLVPNNTLALKRMVMAIQFEEKPDMERALQYRQEAIALADNDRQQFDGDNQTPIFQVVPGFGVQAIPRLGGFYPTTNPPSHYG